MKTNGLNAWLLYKKPQGETSVYATFFTEQHGIINVNIKGGRSVKKYALLQAFIPLWITLDKKLNFVNQLEMNGESLSLQSESLFAGLYVNELVYYFLKAFDGHEVLFRQYEKTLKELNANLQRTEIGYVLRQFEMSLLKQCGYELSLNEDENRQPIEIDKYYSFFPDQGFKLAPSGFKGEYIIAFANNDFSNPRVLPVAKIITRAAIDFALEGRNIKARSLYISGV